MQNSYTPPKRRLEIAALHPEWEPEYVFLRITGQSQDQWVRVKTYSGNAAHCICNPGRLPGCIRIPSGADRLLHLRGDFLKTLFPYQVLEWIFLCLFVKTGISGVFMRGGNHMFRRLL